MVNNCVDSRVSVLSATAYAVNSMVRGFANWNELVWKPAFNGFICKHNDVEHLLCFRVHADSSFVCSRSVNSIVSTVLLNFQSSWGVKEFEPSFSPFSVPLQRGKSDRITSGSETPQNPEKEENTHEKT